ncbi:MAG: DUF4962 domain-containing protein [Armatimonadetes bacterium]|nr:DUF4962 domain-containing protein [Armatimonadota bacterium]
MRRIGLLAMAGVLAAYAAAQENRFANPSFEETDARGNPASWTPVSFATGGAFAVGEDGGKTGARYGVLRATEEKHRSCWRQLILWSDTDEGVTVGGWYRTRGVAPGQGKGASIRFLFNSDPAKWEHLRLDTVYFPPSEEWAEAKASFSVPKGTRAIVIELFHWYTPGETHWDEVWIRPAAKGEVQVRPLDPALAVDREPVYGRNLPYSPADGETVKLNPPPFRWLPSGDVTYRLQVAREAGFGGEKAVDLEGLQWCAEMLTQPLAAGTWYWRYGVDRVGEATIWSTARRFEVPEDATPWPYPGREALKAPKARPRLFVTAARLAEFRRRATEGDLRGTADALVAAVWKYAGEDLVPEPDWLPKDAAERAQTYTTIIRTTRPPMDRMEQAALAYLLTGDADCGAEAKRRILHFFAWDPVGPTGVFHNDEPAMWVMMRGVRAYDWTYDLFTPEEREKVEAAMRLRAADFYKKMRGMPYENNPFESHAGRIIGFLGEAAIAFLNEWPEATEWLDYITRIYWGVYPAWGKDDGGWNEGPGYWSAYMSFALHFVLALREATGIDLSQRPFFHNTPYYLLYLSPPHSQMSPFGDGTQWQPSRQGALMYWFSTLTRDPYVRWYADALKQGPGSDIMGIVLKDDTLKAEAPVSLPTARLFEGVGLACLHTSLTDGEDDVAFTMRSSPYGAVSHGHNDQNCFVLEAFGEPLAIASGYYNYYGSPHHDLWTRQTKAKCGITFDGGVGQDRGWQAQGNITAFQHTDAFDLITGDATPAYGGKLTRAIREVVHVRPGVFVIRDDLASETPRRFEYWLHAIDPMQVDEAAGSVLIARPKATLTTRFLYPAGLSITQTDQFDPPPTWPPDAKFANNRHVTAALREPAQEAQFLTVLLPAKAGQEGRLPTLKALETGTARGVELTYADGSRAIVGFAKPGATGDVRLADVTSNARVFAVRWDAKGSVKASMVEGGRRLEVGG